MRLIIIINLLISYLFSSTINFSQEEKQYIQTQKTPIKIGVLNSYKPFSFLKNNKEIGFTNDLLEIISQKSGLRFEKTSGSWSQIYPLFKKGKFDMISEISYREDRVAFTEFTEPYYEVPLGIFTNGIYKYQGLRSLENKKVAVIKDSFLKTLLEEIKGIEIIEVNSTDEKFQVLLRNQVDIVISSAMSILYTESLMYKDIKLSGYFEHPEVKKEDLRFGIQKSNQLLASIIKKSFQSIDYAQLTQLKQKWIFSTAKKHNGILLNLTNEEKEFIETKQITVGIESAKPYIFYNKEQQDIDGLYADILKEVLQHTGLKVKFIQDDWSNLLNSFKNKDLDLLPATFYSKEREKFGHYSKEYYKVREYIYTKANNKTTFENLDSKVIAVVKGYATIKKLKKRFPSIKIIETKNLAESISLVLDGGVDALIDYHLVVESFLKDHSIIGLRGIPQTYLDAISVHYLSHIDKPILHSILQKGLAFTLNHDREKIFREWFSDIYQEIVSNTLTLNEKRFIEEHPVIRFRVRPNRAPFEFEENGKALGIAVDYVKKSAENIGLKVKFVIDNTPVKEAYKIMETSRDKFDTVLFSVKNPERNKRFSFGADYLSYPMMIITHKDTTFIGGLKNLKGKTIVLEKGFLTNKWIKRDYPEIKIQNVKDTKTALEMVNKGDVVAYVGNLGVANYMSAFGGMDNIKVAAPSDYGNVNYSFVAPKEWGELTSLLSKGYKQITPLEHTAIQQKWFSVQTIDKTNYKMIGTIVIVLIFIILWILWWNRKLSLERQKTEIALDDLQKVKQELELKNKEIQESELFIQSMLDESPNPIILKNYDGKFVLVNKAVATLYNTTKEKMIGKDDGDFIQDKKMAEFFKQNVKEIMDNGETQIVYEDSQDVNTGETRHFMSIKKPFTNIHGEKVILVIANDITEIKKLEEEKLRNQEILFSQSKVAAMGEMIGNIAHQWRQPLSVISTASTGLIMEKEIGVLTDEKLKTTLESINDYAQYLSTTIDTFRDYVKTEKVYKEVVLQDRINVALNIVEASFKNNYITIKTNLDTLEPIKIKLVVGELSEVLINILNNSKDALKERKVKKDPWVKLEVQEVENKIIISIEDNAGGIPEDIMPKIFEPYFTTKHQSQGTGLGLHMSYKIITESLNGKIYAINTENGAKFTIELPKE